MARNPYDLRRTADQVLIDALGDDIEELKKRIQFIERIVWWSLGGTSGIGFIVGIFSKQIARMVLP